jgi:hypothetical protein
MKHVTAKTSVAQVPAAYKEPKLREVYRHSRNLDFGGGKYDLATQYLDGINCQNFVYDPYCRTQAHNITVLHNLGRVEFNTVSCLNVLNVQVLEKDRAETIEAIKTITVMQPSIKHVVFQIYTKDKSGAISDTQLNKPAEFYWPALIETFREWKHEIVGAKKNIIHFMR